MASLQTKAEIPKIMTTPIKIEEKENIDNVNWCDSRCRTSWCDIGSRTFTHWFYARLNKDRL